MKSTLVIVAIACGCAAPGLGPAVHNDFTAQMQGAQPALSSCYAKGLAAAPIQGTMTLAFAAAPSTGQFVDVVVIGDQLRDPALEACVVAAVGGLRLAQPQSSRVAVSYPIHFAPAP